MSALSKLPVVAESLQNQLKLELTLYFNCRFRGDRYFAFRINGQQLCTPSVSFPYENEGDEALNFFTHVFGDFNLTNLNPSVNYFDIDGTHRCPVLVELPISARDKIPIVEKQWMRRVGALVWISEASLKILFQSSCENSEYPLFQDFNPSGMTYPEGLSVSHIFESDVRWGRIIA